MALAGRVALITGAASGLGRATALRFAGAGARVVLVDLPSPALAEAVEEVRATAAKADGVVAAEADVTSEDQVRDGVACGVI